MFEAVVDSAHDERFRLMQAAADRGHSLQGKLQEILADLFEYSQENRELMRLTFATAFANAGDAPGFTCCRTKGRRNFDFIKSLIADGQRAGELDPSFAPEELAMGIYGQLNSYVMVSLLVPECPLNRETAHRIVRLFFEGASGQLRSPAGDADRGDRPDARPTRSRAKRAPRKLAAASAE